MVKVDHPEGIWTDNRYGCVRGEPTYRILEIGPSRVLDLLKARRNKHDPLYPFDDALLEDPPDQVGGEDDHGQVYGSGEVTEGRQGADAQDLPSPGVDWENLSLEAPGKEAFHDMKA